MLLYNLLFTVINPKSIFCKHEYEWFETIHGDMINSLNYRTTYKCKKCGKEKHYKTYIQKDFNWNIYE